MKYLLNISGRLKSLSDIGKEVVSTITKTTVEFCHIRAARRNGQQQYFQVRRHFSEVRGK